MTRRYLKYYFYDKEYFGVYYYILFVKSIENNKQIHLFQKINNIMCILLDNIKIYYGKKDFINTCEKRKISEIIIMKKDVKRISDQIKKIENKK